jgi:phage repressor protein C with HTH and peptisase S24 domain
MSSENLQDVGINFLELIERLKSALKADSDADLARSLGISPKKLSVWKLRNFIPYELLVTVCSHFGLNLNWVVLNRGEMFTVPHHGTKEIFLRERAEEYNSEFVSVPMVSGSISAGGGLVPDNTVELKIAFRREWIQRRGDPKNMSLIRVSGDSMDPTLQSGDLALVDHGKNYVDPQGGIYAIAIDQTIMIKRIQVLYPSNQIRVISDNERYQPIETDPGHIKINGKVIWFGREIER